VKVKDGGPAFPHVVKEVDCMPRIKTYDSVKFDGASLRDYFAAAALTGMLANGIHEQKPIPPTETMLARVSYGFADAMLREREKEAAE